MVLWKFYGIKLNGAARNNNVDINRQAPNLSFLISKIQTMEIVLVSKPVSNSVDFPGSS